MTLLCEPRCELVSRAPVRLKGFQEGTRRAAERAVAAVEPLDAVDAADTEPWLELVCRGASGEDWGRHANVTFAYIIQNKYLTIQYGVLNSG
ncbi:jg9589 [Pararge aegeria aegeria]|uniref:Jg9589 protein n=1 Tax=Pararge aegeria aegeria TaxID=348720 RepID=A0A8S4SDT3_9NEOP|nr:jg9589 [Pararge aegeria aegeria]